MTDALEALRKVRVKIAGLANAFHIAILSTS
jgi:hypothetical protein